MSGRNEGYFRDGSSLPALGSQLDQTACFSYLYIWAMRFIDVATVPFLDFLDPPFIAWSNFLRTCVRQTKWIMPKKSVVQISASTLEEAKLFCRHARKDMLQ